MIVRRLTVFVAVVLCGCIVVLAGCGTADIGGTTSTAGTTITTVTIGSAIGAETTQLYPVRVDGRWGFIGNTGAVKIAPQFAGIRRLDGEGGLVGFCEGLCAVQTVEAGPWGYIDTTGAWAIEPRFDDGGSFSEGLAIVWQEGTCGYIDETGEVVIPIQYEIAGFGFSGGVALVGYGYDGAPTYIGKTGRVIWQGE